MECPPIIIILSPCAPPLSLLAILACLLAQHAYPVKGRAPLLAFYGRMALSAAKRLNTGDRNSGVLGWAALMAAVLVPVMLVTAVARWIHPVVVFLLDLAALYWTLRFLATTRAIAANANALTRCGIQSITKKARAANQPKSRSSGSTRCSQLCAARSASG